MQPARRRTNADLGQRPLSIGGLGTIAHGDDAFCLVGAGPLLIMMGQMYTPAM